MIAIVGSVRFRVVRSILPFAQDNVLPPLVYNVAVARENAFTLSTFLGTRG